MTMTPSLRKFALTAHVTSSVGLLGSITALLALAVAGLTSQDAQIVRAAYPAMELIARFVIVPLAFASLLTGLIQSLGTPWGLTPYGRHKQHEQRAPLQQHYLPSQRPSLDSNSSVGVWPSGESIIITLRRAYVLGFIIIVVVAHMVILHLTSGGPGHN